MTVQSMTAVREFRMTLDEIMAETIEVDEWMSVLGFDGLYEVSRFGVVRISANRLSTRFHNKRAGDLVAANPDSNGRLQVNLHRPDGCRVRRSVHVLVCEAFHGPRPSPSHEACHGDGDHLNNIPSNLRWDTRRGNMADRVRHGTHARGARSVVAKLTEQQAVEIKFSELSSAALARVFGVSDSTICRIRKGLRWPGLTRDGMPA